MSEANITTVANVDGKITRVVRSIDEDGPLLTKKTTLEIRNVNKLKIIKAIVPKTYFSFKIKSEVKEHVVKPEAAAADQLSDSDFSDGDELERRLND
mgnify:CR=1 FL=1